jgi:hypothetical protein
VKRPLQNRRNSSPGDTLERRHVRLDLRSVLFDLDGTLIDSVYHHIIAWSKTLEAAGIVFPKWKIHRRVAVTIGTPAGIFIPGQ